jgi:predicted membrane protein
MHDDPNQDGEKTEFPGWNDAPFRGRCRRRRSPASRLFFAVFLIVAGILLFLSNIGLLPVRDVWEFWPVILIAAGIGRLLNAREAVSQIVSILLIVFGSLSLLWSLGVFHLHTENGTLPLSLLFIAFGVAALIKILGGDRSAKASFGFRPQPFVTRQNQLRDCAILGAVKRRIETENYEGGALLSLFGGVELDLRRARISNPDNSAALEVNAIFGAVKLRVPETWRINVVGAAVLGAYDDKTIAPNLAVTDAPTLFIEGYSVFGAVEIEN